MASDIRFIRKGGRVIPIHGGGGNVSSGGHKMSSKGSRSISAGYYSNQAKMGHDAAVGNLGASALSLAIGITEHKTKFGKIALGIGAASGALGLAQLAKSKSQARMASDLRQLKKGGKK